MTDTTQVRHFTNVSRETFTAYMYQGDDHITLEALDFYLDPVDGMAEMVKDSDENSMNWFNNGQLEKVLKNEGLEPLTGEGLYEMIEQENPDYDEVELMETHTEALEKLGME